MDKVKEIGAFVLKYRFWFITLIVVLLTTIPWYLATNTLAEQTEANTSKVTSEKSAVERIRSTPNHPNPQFHAGMEAHIDVRAKEVAEAWQEKWNRLVDLLVWPKELGPDFIEEVQELRPIEAVSADKTIPIDLRRRYRDYIKEELPKLAQVVGAHWVAGQSEDAIKRLSAARPEIVSWNPDNQNKILQSRFDWTSQPDQAPTTKQVLYAQEDLWVLKALMDIIEKTNENAKARHNAAIKHIDFLQIGKDITGRVGSVTRLGGTQVNPAGGGDVFGGGFGASPGGFGADEYGGGGPAVAADPNDPANDRYVDKNYQPVSGAVLRDAAQSDSPDTAYLVVAKRMPVRMRVVMDQRKIDRLLTECGNSPLTVEVRQVRINRPPGGSGSGGGSAGFGGGGGGGFGGGGEDDRGGGVNEGVVDKAFPYDRFVEIYGIVYIYNPVDYRRLKITPEALPESTDDGSPTDATGGETPDTATEPAPAG